MKLVPVTLTGSRLRLEPLRLQHADLIWQAISAAPEIWRYMPIALNSAEHVRGLLAKVEQMQEAGTGVGFAIYEKSANEFVGASGYWNPDLDNRRVEIGMSWIVPKWQRTFVNTEAKYLLLQHAFEQLGCIRVEFKTDSLNTRSQQALKRIGAQEEGTLRNHMIQPDGRFRHSVYFSVIASEWPAVKLRLEEMMAP